MYVLVAFVLSIKKERRNKKKRKQRETELTASVLKEKKERSKTHKRLKRTPFNWTKQNKNCEFSRKFSFFFQATHNMKTEKQTISSLNLRHFDVGRLTEG